jgi:hypothetical protein
LYLFRLSRHEVQGKIYKYIIERLAQLLESFLIGLCDLELDETYNQKQQRVEGFPPLGQLLQPDILIVYSRARIFELS